MPEYGRNVQRMVDYALTLEDRTERNECAQAIMQTMQNLFPYLRNEESKHKMYDHLAMMADYKLDIDSPYEMLKVPAPAEADSTPITQYVNTAPLRFRHYGRIIPNMIRVAIAQNDEQMRKQLTIAIANRMKQDFAMWNKDAVDDERIRQDIALLSDNKLSTDFEEFKIDAVTIKTPANQKQQKKKGKRKL